MSVSSGPQTGPGHPAVPVTDPRSPDPPSALSDQDSAAAAAAQGEDGDNDDDAAAAYESRHVHTVYEAIAPHFSSTRYKPWPLVAAFLLSLPPGSVGLDAGCGNGKYIGVNPSLFIVASDRSANLVSLARSYQPPHFDAAASASSKKKNKNSSDKNSKKATDASASEPPAPVAPAPAPAPAPPKNQVLVADSLSLPYRNSAFDFAISIAVIHHMSTRERRRAAVAALLSAVRPGSGKVLIMVWALEQGNSRRGWDAGAAQDQLVSWVTKGKKEKKPEQGAQDQEQAQTQMQAQAQAAGPAEPAESVRDETFQRYYHLYREGELEEDVVHVGGRVLESGYERDNWWAIFCRDS
ncbi:tRNA (Uracil-5-)-methyltransferase TRM9 [Colletotrichum orchidophilum]|uniref:tRNA (Uracil-5-)-methyltransferase TRM9 n=1 Tax=Colletotrichum orchidophilum TaxID=1209926 RepID=A0A1G4BG87_9PEZI|nr:tRNA (Uracil-5-)-methyltransferase TRM9 [Colletotrichum orchidophilum]OHF00404.1 tRNA (Uracil-5-)-methyltransferase TRM9 [Colletotrichum orchidophilum]